ncbi:hypothetical protein [Phaeobacter porticola]|uniref:Uncharacterized protein n=1 Tax=Phaeobacter porticola TaxID=1844006 RepID=A0A1L3I3W6_9RHOB|nr:hypothetical protein [Phaeobacter porticola]APG46749.1 hypothetical protein PhaeoP97_01326 [Phaeobacter porticola]
MTVLDMFPSKISRSRLSGGLLPVIAAVALLTVLGLPALLTPIPQTEQLDWRGNSASVQDLR